MRSFWLAVLVVLSAGCPSTRGGSDAGNSAGICPAHPEQCGGKCCGSTCIDTQLDVANCGDCGIACSPGQVCSAGRCGCLPSGAPCSATQTCCPRVGCKFTDSDINNCGGCGISCGSGARCENNACSCGGVACGLNQTCCNGVCAVTCASNPDMASSSTQCTCASMCPLSKQCLADNCCFEDVFLMTCTVPNPPTCTQRTY